MNPSIGLLANFLSLATVLATYHHSGDPRVVVFTFILLSLARFINVEIFFGINHFFPGARAFLERFVSPAGKRKPNLVTEGGTDKPTGDWGYFLFTMIPALMAFVIMTREQDVSLETLQAEVEWSFIYLGIYWAQDLFDKKTVMNFDQSRIFNLAYNMGPVMMLFFAVMVGGGIYSIFQKHLQPSPWFVCGPLILFKHLSDLHLTRRRLRNLIGKKKN